MTDDRDKNNIIYGNETDQKSMVLVISFVVLLLAFFGMLILSSPRFNEVFDNIKYGPNDNIVAAFSLSSNTNISRNFSVTEYNAGEAFDVTIKISIDPNDKIINYGIEEKIPTGWTISDVSQTDYYFVNRSSNTIYWIVNSSDILTSLNSLELNYKVIPYGAGIKNFFGEATFTSYSSGNPVLEGIYILGSIQLGSSNGECGDAERIYENGEEFPGAYNLCSLGTNTNSSVKLDDANGSIATWQCMASTLSLVCEAQRIFDIIDGVCGTEYNICIKGNLFDISDSTSNYMWECGGINGGLNISCSKEIPVNNDDGGGGGGGGGSGSRPRTNINVTNSTNNNEDINISTNNTLEEAYNPNEIENNTPSAETQNKEENEGSGFIIFAITALIILTMSIILLVYILKNKKVETNLPPTI